jgi:hypothetical protein
MNITIIHPLAVFLTILLFNSAEISAEDSYLHTTFRDVVSAEINGMGREWKVETSKEINRLLSFFTSDKSRADFSISMPQFFVRLNKSDGTSLNLYIGSACWTTSGADGNFMMTENWGSYFWDAKNHDPSIRRVRFATAELERKERQEVMMEKLSSISVDEISFKNADLDGAVSTLEKICRTKDPDGAGVSIVFNDPEYVTDQDGYEIPRISVNLRNVSFLDAIRTIATLSHRDVLYNHNLVVIGKPKLHSRVYTVLPGVTQIDLKSIEVDMKAKLKNHGIDFPSGTSITYVKNPHQFIITHTENTFIDIEDVWLNLNSHSAHESPVNLDDTIPSQP